MKKITLMSVLAILCLNLRAQQPALKPLSIGDTVPDITLTNVYNYPSSTIRLSDLKGKLVILDFWAVWCGSCIRVMPKIDSLQKKFSKRLRILLINDVGETDHIKNEKRVYAFFISQNSKTNGSFSLPSTLKRIDTLEELFAHSYIPHYVWISAEGKIIGITSSDEITKRNIKAALKGNPKKMPLKKDRP